MASENSGTVRVSTTVPEDVERWLEETAAELDVSRAALIRQLLKSTRRVIDGDADVSLESRMDELEVEYQDALADVRERVVDVKLDVDEKASVDHDHPELTDSLANATGQVEALQDAVDELQSDVDSGFENYEDVLEGLADVTDDLDEKLDSLAGAVVQVRDRTSVIAGRHAALAAVDDLAATANRHGIRTAKCESCESSVDIALLRSPECPFCASTFTELQPKQGLFGSSVLVVGDAPALDGDVVTDDGLSAILGDGGGQQ